MRRAALVAILSLFALAVVGVAVGPGHDSTILVPPPDAVAESFMHQVQARRYDRAMQYVDPSSGISVETIRISARALDARTGGIQLLEGQDPRIAGDTATAVVWLKTARGGELRPSFSLVRRSAQWRITEWSQP